MESNSKAYLSRLGLAFLVSDIVQRLVVGDTELRVSRHDGGELAHRLEAVAGRGWHTTSTLLLQLSPLRSPVLPFAGAEDILDDGMGM